jgi:homotetrameric cytidine deaminase
MNADAASLLRAAADAAARAHCPYSGFRVGAAVLSADGRVYAACNVENASYGLTICAERAAVFRAVAEGARSFKAVAVVADAGMIPWPCGACCQVLAEFCADDVPVYAARLSDLDAPLSARLGDLLPRAFRLPGSRPPA